LNPIFFEKTNLRFTGALKSVAEDVD